MANKKAFSNLWLTKGILKSMDNERHSQIYKYQNKTKYYKKFMASKDKEQYIYIYIYSNKTNMIENEKFIIDQYDEANKFNISFYKHRTIT